MRLAPLVLLSTALALTACTASVVEESQPPKEEVVTFTGTHTEVDLSQSTVAFLGKSNIVNHPGSFKLSAATLTPDAQELANFARSSITVTIDIASVQTDAEKLTAHLQKEEFFYTDVFPQATFVSTQIVQKEENHYEVTGDLTVKGITKTAVWLATVSDTSLVAHYDLPRKAFGIGNDSYGNKLLDPLVPVDVTLVLK